MVNKHLNELNDVRIHRYEYMIVIESEQGTHIAVGVSFPGEVLPCKFVWKIEDDKKH